MRISKATCNFAASILYFLIDLIIIILMVAAFASCTTTRYVPVESVRTEYKDRVVAVHDTVRDSVRSHNYAFQKDSMAMSIKGDTVFVDRWHTLKLIKWEKATHMSNTVAGDSASTVKADSVQVPYPVERKLTRWERAKMDFGTAAITIAVIAIIAAITTFAWWFRKKIRENPEGWHIV